MQKFISLLSGGVAHLKSFPGSKLKKISHHAIMTLEEYEYDAAILHVGINDSLRFDKNSGIIGFDLL